MDDASSPIPFASEMRMRLHDVNDELSIAVLQQEMLLEDSNIPAPMRASLEESLDACRKAAGALKEIWLLLGQRPAP
jgi:hypothetical protein